MGEIMNGYTWFLRCASCHEMYVACAGFDLSTGGEAAYWIRPRPIKKPIQCKHKGDAEIWNGSAWLPVAEAQATSR